AAISRFVAMEAGRAYLTGVRRVYPCHCHARPLRFVGDEGGELMEGPGGDQAVVFAGVGRLAAIGPTAFWCGALAEASCALQAGNSHALLLSMGDDSLGELLVHVAHPALLFALALPHGADLRGFLQLFTPGVELAALGLLLAAIAKEACAAAQDMHHGGHLH